MDITSANSVFTISASGANVAATNLEGYAVDSSFSIDSLETGVAQQGIDGKMSVGWVPRLTPITLNFAADSPSIRLFEIIQAFADVARSPVFINGTLELPSIGRSYNFGRGTITSMKMMPSGERVLGPQSVTITFEALKPSLI